MSERLLREWVHTLLLAEVSATASEIFKDFTRVTAYLDQIKNETPFELVSGETIIIPAEGNDALVFALESNDAAAFQAAWSAGVETSDGIKKVSGIIKKTEALGGERAGKRLDKEVKQIGEIQAAIQAAGGTVNINLGGKVANGVTSIESIAGTPKADAVLLAGEPGQPGGSHVGYISLKYASRPSQMQQWGGLTKLYNDDVASVVEFIKDVQYIEETSPSGRIGVTYFREIDQLDIARKICYGANFDTGKSGKNNCDLIIASQSPIQIDKSGNFIADNIWANPDIPGGEWYPTLFARYARGRGGGTALENVRLSLSPKGARKGEPLPLRKPPEVEAPSSSEVEAAADDIVDEALIRRVVRDAIILEGISNNDNKEGLDRVVESDQFKPAQDSPRNIALRLLEEHGLEIAMNIAARDGNYAVLKILTDFGPDAASDVRHFPFGRM